MQFVLTQCYIDSGVSVIFYRCIAVVAYFCLIYSVSTKYTTSRCKMALLCLECVSSLCLRVDSYYWDTRTTLFINELKLWCYCIILALFIHTVINSCHANVIISQHCGVVTVKLTDSREYSTLTLDKHVHLSLYSVSHAWVTAGAYRL